MQPVVVANPFPAAGAASGPPAVAAPADWAGTSAAHPPRRPIEAKQVCGCPVDGLTACVLIVATIAITAAFIAWGYVASLQDKVATLEVAVSRLAASPAPSASASPAARLLAAAAASALRAAGVGAGVG